MSHDLTASERRASRFLLFVLAVLAFASFFILRPFLSGTIFALVIGWLLQRPYRGVRRVVRYPWLAAGILVLVVVLAVVVPLALIGLELVRDARTLIDNAGAGGWSGAVTAALVSLGMDEAQARELLTEGVAQATTVAKAIALPTLGALASVGANIGVFVFLLYFVLVGGEAMGTFVRRALPLEDARREHLLGVVGERVRALFLGTFLVAVIQGIAAGIGWWIFGFPNPVFWGFVMTLLAVIPAIGPILVMAPAGIFALLQGDTFAGIAIIAWAIAVVGLVDNVTRPYIVGRSTGVHPAVVLLGTLGGLVVFGATGFIIGPLILSMVAPILTEWESIRPGPG